MELYGDSIEIDEKYFAIAKNRIENHKVQEELL